MRRSEDTNGRRFEATVHKIDVQTLPTPANTDASKPFHLGGDANYSAPDVLVSVTHVGGALGISQWVKSGRQSKYANI